MFRSFALITLLRAGSIVAHLLLILNVLLDLIRMQITENIRKVKHARKASK